MSKNRFITRADRDARDARNADKAYALGTSHAEQFFAQGGASINPPDDEEEYLPWFDEMWQERIPTWAEQNPATHTNFLFGDLGGPHYEAYEDGMIDYLATARIPKRNQQ